MDTGMTPLDKHMIERAICTRDTSTTRVIISASDTGAAACR